MAYAKGRYVITFNGEIYNYVELRAELESKGERFVSQSDTEVLLGAYKVWGRACVTHLRGMFAFALWDETEKTLFLARDRVGERPLFYHRDGDQLTFASELKALLPLLSARPRIEPAAADMYLHYQYVPEPFTPLSDIRKLPAAHTLTVSADEWHAEPKRYWNVEEESDELDDLRDTSDILERIRNGLEEAVKLTLRADVPVGIALSGGIDSGAIAALAQKHYPERMHAFCVGYPGRPRYDERAQARALGEQLGMLVHEVELPVDSFVDFFPHLVRILDEPIADPAAFGHYSVPRAAADLGIKVLLTGIGGDELFWGYPWVARAAWGNEVLERIPGRRLLAQVLRWPRPQALLRRSVESQRTPPALKRWSSLISDIIADGSTPSDQLCFYTGSPEFSAALQTKRSVCGPALAGLAANNAFVPTAIGPRSGAGIPVAIVRMLFDTWLASNCLSLGDRVAMSMGVETRLPFLDSHFIELVMALRRRVPDHRQGQKAWLRAALKGVLPDDVLARPKAGFQPPVWEWLSGVLARYGDTLRGGCLVQSGIVHANRIDHVLNALPKQGWHGLFYAYKLLLLETWHREVAQA